MRYASVALAGWVCAVTCVMTPVPARTDVTADVHLRAFIPAPAGGVLRNAIWLPVADEIVTVFDPANTGPAERHLYAVALDGSNFHRLPLPDDLRACGATAHYSPRPLSDGRLAYISQCYGSGPNVPREANTLMAYDPRTGQTTPLFPYFLHANQGQYAIAPDLRRGIIGDGHSLLEQLVWLLPDRTEKLPLPVGRALSPAWSPDGSTIAFVGTPQGGNSAGPSRLDLPHHLYVMSGDGRDLRRVLGGEIGVGGPSWSPDGRFLAATMFVNGREGIWLVEVASGRLWHVLDEDETSGATFLPDGRTLIVPIGIASRVPIIPPKTGPAPRVGLLVLTLPLLSGLR